jgi:hypothetical protein
MLGPGRVDFKHPPRFNLVPSRMAGKAFRRTLVGRRSGEDQVVIDGRLDGGNTQAYYLQRIKMRGLLSTLPYADTKEPGSRPFIPLSGRALLSRHRFKERDSV